MKRHRWQGPVIGDFLRYECPDCKMVREDMGRGVRRFAWPDGRFETFKPYSRRPKPKCEPCDATKGEEVCR